jgi:putative zinc finger/helix-turn-helix YgiT family protein
MERCPTCREGTMSPAAIEVKAEVAGHVFRGAVRGSRCDRCGETLTPGPEIERFELKVGEALARAEPSGEAARFIRKALGYRAADLAALLGMTPETVSRWENDKVPIPRSTWILLRLLVLDRLEGPLPRIDAVLQEADAPVQLRPEVEIEMPVQRKAG